MPVGVGRFTCGLRQGPQVVRFREERRGPLPPATPNSAEVERVKHGLELTGGALEQSRPDEVPGTPNPNGDGAASVSAASTSGVTPSAAAQPPGFQLRRLVVFSGLIIGYAAYYLTRNSLTYTAPVMVADPSLGFSMTQIGAMTSIFPIAYGMSKFVAGIVGDRYSPALLLGGGLLATAACNLAFGASGSMAAFCTLWALNGLLQGVGAPSCARMLTSWFSTRERGTFWGLWNVAHNMGGFVSPLVAAGAAHAAGWRWGMWAPGLAGLVAGVYVLLACRDSPKAAGFNAVEPAAAPKPAPAAAASSAAGTAAAAPRQGVLRKAVDNVLSNPAVWALALTYFCVYVVRQGVTSWSVFYLMREKGVANAAEAAMRVSGLELGGLAGSLVAGGLSDWLIRRGGRSGAGTVGTRVKVVMGYMVGLAAAVAAFQSLPAAVSPALQWLSVAAIGFFIYGPQMLVGLCGAELVHPDSVGASQGVLGWVAYLGAANAGMPLSLIVERFGWSAYFSTLLAACGVAVALLLPLAGLRSYQQRQAEAGGSGGGGAEGARLKAA